MGIVPGKQRRQHPASGDSGGPTEWGRVDLSHDEVPPGNGTIFVIVWQECADVFGGYTDVGSCPGDVHARAVVLSSIINRSTEDDRTTNQMVTRVDLRCMDASPLERDKHEGKEGDIPDQRVKGFDIQRMS